MNTYERFLEQQAWIKAHPIRGWFYNKYWDIRAFIYNIPNMPMDFYRKCKRGWQRAYRGWADEDTWSLSSYLSKVIKESLVYFKNNQHTIPGDFVTSNSAVAVAHSEEKWNEILNKIIWTFEVNEKIDNGSWFYPVRADRFTDEDVEKLKKLISELKKLETGEEYHIMTDYEVARYRSGWELFQKYYFSLWD